MWNMNPNETRVPNEKVFQHNAKYLPDYRLIGPAVIEPLLPMFPDIHKQWDTIPHWVIKADIARLLYIYAYGGVYLDCDCLVQQPLPKEPWVCVEKIVPVHALGPKESKHPSHSMRIANYAFGFPKHHPLLKAALEECARRLPEADATAENILWVCGPDVMTTVYHRYEEKSKIALLNHTYIKHLAAGSWR
jgi:mannosyltransferase OCH1-like enzyme